MRDTEHSETRRNVLRTVVVGGATVIAPSFATVVRGATSSGNVEITTTTTQPTDTSVSIRAYEDLDDDGNAENQQEKTITAGTDVVTEYPVLEGTEGDAAHYWFDVNLSTTDDTVTPEVDSMTITLPENGATGTPTPTEQPDSIEPPDNEQSLFELWENYRAYVSLIVLAFAGMSLWSRSLTLAALSSYTVFAYIAVTTGTVLFVNIVYVTLVLIFVGFAFKLWRLEFGGE